MGEANLAEHIDELDEPGPQLIQQIDGDLAFLTQRTTDEQVSAAYRNLFRNPRLFHAPRELFPVLYEVRAAAMLASVARQVRLAPRVGSRQADLMCVIGASRIFVEATTLIERWPPPSRLDNIEWYERASVDPAFDPMPRPDGPKYRGTPVSTVLRDRIAKEARQLPDGDPSLIVLGAPYVEAAAVEAALFGDEQYFKLGQYPNGLFAIADEEGGASRISALAWLRLVPVWSGVRVHARLFMNPRAACPLPGDVASSLRGVFDRREVLKGELQRIRQLLIEQYHATRIILFGSLATERRKGGDWIHQYSDIDLAVVADTSARFSDRIGEVLRLVRPRVGLNVLVYTPDEFERAEREGGFFVRDEILARGHQLYP